MVLTLPNELPSPILRPDRECVALLILSWLLGPRPCGGFVHDVELMQLDTTSTTGSHLQHEAIGDSKACLIGDIILIHVRDGVEQFVLHCGDLLVVVGQRVRVANLAQAVH